MTARYRIERIEAWRVVRLDRESRATLALFDEASPARHVARMLAAGEDAEVLDTTDVPERRWPNDPAAPA